MIISNHNKNAILLIPKTGTRAVLSLFLNDECSTVIHPGFYYYDSRHRVLDNADDYTYHAFYRCPVNRSLSHYYYVLELWHMTAVTIPGVSKYADEILQITFPEYLTLLEENAHTWEVDGEFEYPEITGISFAAPQTKWLNDSVNLLDYRNFDQETIRLQQIMGRKETTIAGKSNVSIKRTPREEILTPDNIARIKDLYKYDYDFFSKRGIAFDI